MLIEAFLCVCVCQLGSMSVRVAIIGLFMFILCSFVITQGDNLAYIVSY